jgi:O-succinylbenzoic acid--CoA ligase
VPAAVGRRLVALALAPGEPFLTALERAWADGDAVLPLDPRAPAPATRSIVEALRPHIVVDGDGRHQRDDGVAVDDGVVLVIATSGSTAAPKGVQLTAAALDASARATRDRIGSEPGDRWLSCLPWQHIGGLQVALRARLFDQPLEVHASFEPARVGASDATLVSLVPAQLVRLLDEQVDLRRFRVVLLGGAAAPPALLDRARTVGAPVVTTYGMSETAGGCVYDGVPLDGVGVRVDSVNGRILIRGPVLMTGYRLRPDLTAEALIDGELRTQDHGRWAAGRLVVDGRLDDVIVTGGENVVAARVEAALAAHPHVADVAVTGVSDERWGQRVVAVVVPRGEAPALDDLRRWVTTRESVAAAPKAVVYVETIPRLVSGKPDRRAVDRLAQAAPA